MASPTQIKGRGRLSLILGIIVAAVAFAAVAVADVVTVNDVITGGDTSLTRSDAGTAGVSIQASNTVPVGDGGSGCNASGATPATVTLNSTSANVTANAPTSKSYSGCGSVLTFGYSVASNAGLGSLTTLSTSTTGGKSGSLYQEDNFTVRVLPRAASNLAAAANGATQIDLSWTASPDAADITDYKIYEGATEVGTAAKAATSNSIVGLAPGSSHCYTIKARYNDGSADWFSAAAGGTDAACATTVSDSTPPVITANVVGTLGNDNWYSSDVSLTWTVVDNESAISSQSGCGATSITVDQNATTYTCSATSAGGTTSQSITIKRDATAPVISDGGSTPASPNGQNGWYVSAVSNAFSASDGAGSGLNAACTAAFPKNVSTGTNEGAAVKVNSGACSDLAGNTNNGIDSAAFKIDLAKPTIACGATPTFYLGQPAPTLVMGTLSDPLPGSGPASPSVSAAADTSLAGGGTATLNGSDLAGNAAAPKSCPYNINRIVFKQPIDVNAINIAKSGRVIPIKVNVYTNNVENQVGPVTLGMPVAISCASGVPDDAVEEYAAGGSNSGLNFRWETTFWIYNFDTSNVKLNNCYNVNVSLAGNLAGSFKVQITK